ncbi:MAG: hypothetical protein JSU72_08090 [Deltaproteobacteria bacterium]|nr:MAG: hypothetical protein JSU72_08090 [Deltaproteobacteria bacterium]
MRDVGCETWDVVGQYCLATILRALPFPFRHLQILSAGASQINHYLNRK